MYGRQILFLMNMSTQGFTYRALPNWVVDSYGRQLAMFTAFDAASIVVPAFEGLIVLRFLKDSFGSYLLTDAVPCPGLPTFPVSVLQVWRPRTQKLPVRSRGGS